ncbi:helix-turn-helix transcriptional regulator [Streptomyces sp. MZ04]|uniref:helix-turn-helix domain-containing protein n=1 Tax=Streptomyces sp. MZ04 TaxID=2559236 RepID=UPI00143323F3|nr:helix-turn-helix transcriptional regulator [Streptomyces sp. MZ04]
MAARRRGVRGFDGAVLRAARMRRGMAEEDLGRATGIAASLICAYEDGRRAPEWKTLAAFATALSCAIDELRPGHATTMEDLRCGAGQNQAGAAAAAGLTRSGYAMLENGYTRTLKSDVAAKLASAWNVDKDEVAGAHAAAIQAVGEPAPVLEGAVLDGLAVHFGVSSEALLALARTMQSRTGRNQTEGRSS